MASVPRPVVLSVGFGHSHMPDLLPALREAGRLQRLFATAWPREHGVLQRMAGSRFSTPAVDRLAMRGMPLSRSMARTSAGSEVAFQIAQRLWGRSGHADLQDRIATWSLDRMTSVAARQLPDRQRAWIYHFRSGFGGKSAVAAKRKGALLLCDHSIAYPGELARVAAESNEQFQSVFWSRVSADLEAADAILVNSHYVRETMPANLRERAHVVYTGVDSEFLELMALRRKVEPARPTVQILCAGTMEARKGSDLLPAIAARLMASGLRFTLKVVGDWSPSLSGAKRELENLPQVELACRVARSQLAELMSESDIFVLPTRAEGSARVIAEAGFAGCFIVTTKEAGSNLASLPTGVLSTSDIIAFSDAIVLAAMDLRTLRAGRAERARVARSQVAPDVYVQGVLNLYDRLSGDLG